MLEVRHTIIKEYNKMLCAFHVGKPFDYTHILDMINLLEMKDNISNAKIIAKSFMMDE